MKRVRVISWVLFQAQWNHHSAIISILPDEIR